MLFTILLIALLFPDLFTTLFAALFTTFFAALFPALLTTLFTTLFTTLSTTIFNYWLLLKVPDHNKGKPLFQHKFQLFLMNSIQRLNLYFFNLSTARFDNHAQILNFRALILGTNGKISYY